MGTADLHIHSIYSHDATTTVRAILKQAADAGLNVIAVTDHDKIEGLAAFADRLYQCGALGADARRIGRVFDIAAGELRAVQCAQHRPDTIVRIRGVSEIGGLDGRLNQGG